MDELVGIPIAVLVAFADVELLTLAVVPVELRLPVVNETENVTTM
jgi:hypothetical protein